MSDYLQMPWSIEDTIDHMDKIRCSLIRRLRAVNLDGKAEQDVAELNFDFGRAINALKENQQYRQIGTLEECQEAREKQEARKPIKDKESCIRYTAAYICPRCGKGFTGTGIADYCYHCGQKLDWGKIE